MNQEKTWDELYNHLRWNKETNSLPKVLKNKRVLELGAGTGKTLISILKQKPSSIYAIDFSSKAIEKSAVIFQDKVKLLKADARDLPFPDESFDVVIAYYILNNSLRKDRIKIVKEIRRVLKKNGLCVFEDFSIGDLRNIGKKHRTDSNTIVNENNLICHFFNSRELKELFGDFSKITLRKNTFYPIKSKTNLKREIINIVAKK